MVRLRRSGQPYLKGASSPIHDEGYTVTLIDAIRAINNDPDLDAVEKSQAIKKLAGLKGIELTNYLNEIYGKAYGSDVNTTTPLADFIQTIFLRRRADKKR